VCSFAKRLPSHMSHCASFYRLEEPNWLCLENWEYDHGIIGDVIWKGEATIQAISRELNWLSLENWEYDH